AESLNVAGAMLTPGSATGLGNATEMLVDQGKVSEASATAAGIAEISPWYSAFERAHVLFAQAQDSTLRTLADSLVRHAEGIRHSFGLHIERSLSLREGRLA